MSAKLAVSSFLLASAMSSALATLALADTAADGQTTSHPHREKCYGVALKAQNECSAGLGISCDGSSEVDYQGNAWKYVPGGTCETLQLPGGRQGSLKPLKRDPPP